MPHQRSIVLPHQIKKKKIIYIEFRLLSFAATCFISYTSSEQGRKPNKNKKFSLFKLSSIKSLLSSKSSLFGFILNFSPSLCIYLSTNYHKKNQSPSFFHPLQKSQLINPTNYNSLHSHVPKTILTSPIHIHTYIHTHTVNVYCIILWALGPITFLVLVLHFTCTAHLRAPI